MDPRRELDLLDELAADTRLAGQHRLDAVLAHLHEMAGNREAALRHYRAAADRTANLAERNYLTLKAARLAQG